MDGKSSFHPIIIVPHLCCTESTEPPTPMPTVKTASPAPSSLAPPPEKTEPSLPEAGDTVVSAKSAIEGPAVFTAAAPALVLPPPAGTKPAVSQSLVPEVAKDLVMEKQIASKQADAHVHDAVLAAQMHQQNLAMTDDPQPKARPAVVKRATKTTLSSNLEKQKQAYETVAVGTSKPAKQRGPIFSAAPGSIRNMVRMFNDKAVAAMSSTDERGNVKTHPFPKLRKTFFDGKRTEEHKAMYEKQAA